MVTVEVLVPTPGIERAEENGAFEVAARLKVDGKSHDIEGDPSVFDFEMPVVGITKRRRVTFARDPEEWARSLPGSYRSPYLLAKVVHDDDGPEGTPFWTDAEARHDRERRDSPLQGFVAGAMATFVGALLRRRVARNGKKTRETTHTR
jgi:hypothetical protein